MHFTGDNTQPKAAEKGPIDARSVQEDAPVEKNEVATQRASLCELLDNTIAGVQVMRIRRENHARLRLYAARTVGFLVNVKAGILRDASLDDIEARLSALEEGRVDEGGRSQQVIAVKYDEEVEREARGSVGGELNEIEQE